MTLNATFAPDSGVLINGDKQIRLTEQGRLCLAYFCHHEGVLVSRETFTAECWGARGVIVSDVTVRQTVFRLRKSLAEVGLDSDVLQTVGKSGYLMTPGVITLTGEQAKTEEPAPPPSFQARPGEPAENKSFMSYFKSFFMQTRFPGVKKMLLLMVLIIVAGGAGFYLRLNQFVTTVYYSAIQDSGERHYLINRNIRRTDNPRTVSNIEYWLARQNVPLSQSRYIYIHGVMSDYISALSCSAPIDDRESQCRVLTILGEGQP